MAETLDQITKEGFTLNQHFISFDQKVPIMLSLYQKGQEFIQYSPKDDTIISRYKVLRKEWSLGAGK
jgi:hypothetical protein